MSSVIQNQNRVIRATVTTPPTAGQSRIYVSIPGVPSCCKVNAIRVGAGSNIATWSITLLSDGAAYRGATGSQQPSFVADQMVSSDGFVASMSVIAAFGGSYVKDDTETGTLHVLIATKNGSPLPSTPMVVTADVTPMLYMPERTAFSGNKTFRVLQGTTTTAGIDITQNALRNGNPYLQGGPDNSEKFAILASTSDAVYIGMDTQLPGVLFTVPAKESFGQPVKWEISTATNTWTAVAPTDLFDNTSEGSTASPSGLSYTGTIKIRQPQPTWTARILPDDPLTLQAAAVVGGSVPFVNIINPARFWLRLSAPTATFTANMPLRVVGIQPLAF